MKKMTKREAVDMMAYFSLISISKMGNELIEKLMTPDMIDKMMRVNVALFDNDDKKCERFIVNQMQKFIVKLDAFDDSECQRKNFKGANEK